MSWFQNDKEKSVEYLNKGIEHKRSGEFDKAIESYILARELDPLNINCYYNVGKVQFIVKDYNNSILNYLKGAHVSVINAKNQMNSGENSFLIHQLDNMSRLQRDDLEYMLDVPSVEDVYIMMLDINSCQHIGRSLYMDNDTFDKNNRDIMENLEAYRDRVSGKHSDYYSSLEQSIDQKFQDIGTEYLQQNISWESISRMKTNVNEIYKHTFKFRDSSQKSVFKKMGVEEDSFLSKQQKAIDDDPEFYDSLGVKSAEEVQEKLLEYLKSRAIKKR
ncbi:hypothetical protein N9C34_01480 [Candidatus Marinimicrobia bacterium]|nr:hypothetical protein [Candidatus Neomarinimicrobiota bacterium]